MEPDIEVTVRITNSNSTEIKINFEPWGDEYPLPAGDSVDVAVVGPNRGLLEMETDSDRATLYAWQGSVIRIFHGDQELGAGRWPRSRVPPLPKESN